MTKDKHSSFSCRLLKPIKKTSTISQLSEYILFTNVHNTYKIAIKVKAFFLMSIKKIKTTNC